ncbi:OsmC family peroxiredoxin [Flavobacterium silvisoli]|uniref:OsmC family peroxiredoxin n=1 Tax=Flavobacterium silvisoli TaxID=2529433 RepID=A0A4V2L5C9_9FLAO|nr:OsmC family peroxiredoxin [Flavobacterium silvisoli]TBX70173.1 OsmC family peroxiredoxin [Flavobacterium silvisoli]
MIRNATAVWNGTGKEGKGHLTTQSTVLNQTQYSFGSRFENGIGTNPEELIAAAHSGCFTMKLAFNLQAAGFAATKLKTSCDILFEDGKIVASKLQLTAEVDGITESQFAELVKDAEQNCPISQLLNTAISVTYTLNS